MKALAALMVAFTAAPYSAAAADPAAAVVIVQSICGSCHDVSGAKPKQERPRTPGVPPAFYTIAQDPSHTVEWFGRFMRMPHGQMDNVVLTQSDIDNVSAYILAMRNPKP